MLFIILNLHLFKILKKKSITLLDSRLQAAGL